MEVDNRSYADIINNLHDGLYFVDKRRVITFWNKAAEAITGFKSEEVLNRPCSDNILTHVDDKGNNICLGMCPLAKSIDDGEPREAEVYLHHKDGHRIPVSIRISAVRDSAGEIIGGVELFTDISNQRVSELRVKELEKLAMLDKLTQLANRNYIEKELHNRFEENKRFGVPFGVFFIDIDHFKQFNDNFGHDIGDSVLKFVADTFVKNSRPFDLYGRWGGEEFIGIIRNISAKDLQVMGEKIRMLIEHSYVENDGSILKVTISIGATMVKEGDDIASLIKRADSLLYKGKDSGRNCVILG